jgi:translation initiation factor 2 alpha subunit (eIF-2alpha)
MEGLEEGQIVLCIVNQIVGTTVFVKIGKNEEGTITTSEIAPGRIRNLRDYVIPGKKIVCKILSIRNGRVQLSLRRVKQNERKELLDKIQKENNYNAIIKTVLGREEAEKIIEKINEKQNLSDFFEKLKEKSVILSEYFKKEDAEKIIKIIESKKEKPKEIKNIIQLSSKSSQGINLVKGIINEACKGSKCDVSYIAAGRYSLSIKGEDFKQIKNEISSGMQNIEQQAKKQDCDFELEKLKH